MISQAGLKRLYRDASVWIFRWFMKRITVFIPRIASLPMNISKITIDFSSKRRRTRRGAIPGVESRPVLFIYDDIGGCRLAIVSHLFIFMISHITKFINQTTHQIASYIVKFAEYLCLYSCL